MTVFGRDTLITCLQTLLFGPELARSALEVLAELQATEDDPSIDAEPGKIVHEVRQGKAADALVLALLRHGRRDAALPRPALGGVALDGRRASSSRELREPALRALAWIDEYGDRDGDGFVEYERRSRARAREPVVEGLRRLAALPRRTRSPTAPIAPCEVQGYVYDAKRAHGGDRARGLARPRSSPTGSSARRPSCKRRFDEAYWVEARGGYYALALDGEKRQVDSLCSNIGHLLWSGIVPQRARRRVVDQLMGEALWSGWGVRTMSRGRRRLQPAQRTTTGRSGRTTTR